MELRPALPLNNQKIFQFPVTIFLVIITISIIVIGVVAYSFHLGYRMSAKFSPLVDATMEIRLETTTAHLWFEEIISGDRNEKIENVLKRIDKAMWYATAMLEGGDNSMGLIVPLTDPLIRKNIKEVLVKISTFKEITKTRYSRTRISGIGTPVDQKYDAIFKDFQEQAKLVETQLQAIIVTSQNHYRYLQVILLATLIILTIILLIIFYRYEKQRAKSQKLIHDAVNKVKILTGFLPICASCKKIRDDKGYWNQIESYIKENSEAEFTHGICPECAKKIFPEINT